MLKLGEYLTGLVLELPPTLLLLIRALMKQSYHIEGPDMFLFIPEYQLLIPCQAVDYSQTTISYCGKQSTLLS